MRTSRRRSRPAATASSGWPRRCRSSAPRSAERRATRPWSGSWAPACPAEVASAHALRAELVHAPDMVAVAAATDRTIEDVAKVFFARRRRAAARLARARADADPAPRRGCSAGRCRRCARTPPRRAASSPRRRCSTKRAAAAGRGRRALPARRATRGARRLAPSCARSRARASRTSPASRSRSASCARSWASPGPRGCCPHPGTMRGRSGSSPMVRRPPGEGSLIA